MEPEMQRRNRKSKKIFIPVVLAVFILFMLASASVFAYMTLQNDTIYKGVHVGDQDASGMSRQELKQILDTKFQSALDNMEITLKTEKAETKASYPDLAVKYHTEEAVQNAYSVGRSGNVFVRLLDIARASMNGITLNIPLGYDEAKLDSFVKQFYDMTFVNVKEGALYVSDTKVTIRSGTHGENIDRVKTLELVKSFVESGKGGTIEPEIIITSPSEFNVDELYQQIVSEPADAGYKIENSKVTLVPHTFGRQIDRSGLERIVAELEKTEGTEQVLPITFTEPGITSEMASSMLFRDELASATTRFATGTQNGKNRAHNMELAVATIHNMVLAPGQEFSFNVVVGPRDVETGYKTAHVYSAGKIIDGIGGGICQVSSTMYNAVLKADLEVTERRNHSFTVGYVPLGQDATAFYGGTDFRFVNSTKWPIKLLAEVKGTKITFSMLGTKEAADKTVLISNKILKKTPFEVKYTDDPTLPIGTEKITQEGLDGYVVETYKTIKVDGKVISQKKLHTSTYRPYAELVLRGTKPAAGTSTTTPGAVIPSSGTVTPDGPATPEVPITPDSADNIETESVQDEPAPPAVDTSDL